MQVIWSRMVKMSKYSVAVIVFAIATSTFVNSDIANFDGTTVGDRTISECVNGDKPTFRSNSRNRRMYITTTEYARQVGYTAEEHAVITDDQYALTLHRIVGKPGSPAIFLQHGFVGSSFDWIVIGKAKALAFLLADQGYDVWLGNARGNTYSRCHTKYKTSSFEFWDFSWHEIGVYDLPAMIAYVAKTTDQRVIYIGHSMGTTAFFVMAIERPDIASKIKLMIGLAPVAFIDHITSPVRALIPFRRPIESFVRAFGNGEFLSQSSALKLIVKYACTLTMPNRQLCTDLLLLAAGYNPRHFNYTLAADVLYHVPAGTSIKTSVHFVQEYHSKRFQYYDYGAEINMQLYNNSQPPNYDISKIAVPIGLFWSDDDTLANPVDVMRLYEQLPNKLFNFRVDYPNFNHNDYLYAVDAPEYVYEKILSVIDYYK